MLDETLHVSEQVDAARGDTEHTLSSGNGPSAEENKPVEATKETFIHQTTSLCKVCKNGIPTRIVEFPNGDVWMKKRCDVHGQQDIQISNDAEWYKQTRAYQTPKSPPKTFHKEVEYGCPFDCGACTSHEQKIRLPIVTLTSACNLNCPICYVHNKNADAYHIDKAEFAKILDHLVTEHGGELDLINFTGGDPTMHPNFLDFVEMSQEAGIHRVSICTNGIRLAKEEALVQRIAEIGGRVALSFDSFERDVDYAMQGAHLVELKLRCMELLEKYNVNTTLIPVVTRGYNDHEIGKIIQFGLEKSNIRHIEVHLITYTGQGGIDFPRSGRISMYEVLQAIEETTDGFLKPDDYVPSPCAHPLCYQIAYLLMDPDGGPPIPFLRFLDKQTMYECLADRLYLEPSPRLETAMQEAINRLWIEDEPESERALSLLNRLLRDLFPTGKALSREESLRRSEQWIKAVYVHSHMDEETFDTERAMMCCDSNCYADGSSIPVCNYNVLYREKEAEFMDKPKVWNERSGGQKSFH